MSTGEKAVQLTALANGLYGNYRVGYYIWQE
jgi:hypothetical protein